LALLRLAENDSATIAEITHILEADPAMAGRTLRLANSVWAGARHPVTTVRQAVTRLGARAVRNVTLSFTLIGESADVTCRQFDYKGFWSRSLATAVAAQNLCGHSKQFPPDEAFTCGLLCQIGSLALASIYPKEYGSLLEQCHDALSDDLIRQERLAFATDHNELSAALLQYWGFPLGCAEGVYYHEHPEEQAQESKTPTLAQLLHVAAHFARTCVAPSDQRARLIPALLAYGQLFHLEESALMALGNRVVSEWQEWGKILEVKTQSIPSFTDLAEQARRATPTDVAVEMSFGTPPLEGLKIMVVDDDKIMLATLRKYLTSAGHTVLCARNGREALNQVLESNPHLIITDWMMPEMDGLAFCKTLRQSKIGRHVYIIMLTGCEHEDRLLEAFEAGADDVVIKPFRPKPLLARIRAGQRIIRLQQEVNRDKEELARYAAELAVANRKLQQAALTDALTDLPNRRYALDRLEQEWARALRHGRPLACMILDLDHFKQVNDTYGHDMGDVVLRETASVLRRAIRSADVICRLGGEEFVAICPDTDADAAQRCAERVRAEVEAHKMEAPGFHRTLTVSIGVAVRGEQIKDPLSLLKAADEAVYMAKKAGRNRVCLAGAERRHGIPC
jgi:diguanylate cyclase (GGDEF)-like protein